MRTTILLFLIGFCSVLYAKNKTYLVAENAPITSLQNTEKSTYSEELGLTHNTSNNSRNAAWRLSPLQGTFNNKLNFPISDEISMVEEFSYKNSSLGGGSSLIFLDENTTIQEKASANVGTIFQQGMFYGFVMMLILLNLSSFFLFDEKTFLFYSISLIGTGLLLFFSDGLFRLINWEIQDTGMTVQSLLLFLSVAAASLFASKFLILKENASAIKWITLPLLGIAAIAVIFSGITQNTLFATIANISLFATLFTYFSAGVYLFSKKNYAKFYVIASFIPLLFCFDFFILNRLGVEFLSTETFHIKMAVVAEMLILTYAIMFRMQAIKEENALRQVEMRIFLKRQEVLNTRLKTEKMVEDVYLENLIMHYDLDGMEIKLLQYISEGKENKKIARKLNTTEVEVEEMTKELYKKLEIGEQIQQDYRMVDQQPDYIYN